MNNVQLLNSIVIQRHRPDSLNRRIAAWAKNDSERILSNEVETSQVHNAGKFFCIIYK